MSSSTIFAPDYKETPYWLDAVPLASVRKEPASLPGKADVVVVGGGLTGVSAAWELARGGRNVVVLDAGEPGHGASSSNAGMLGRHCLLPFTKMIEAVELPTAQACFAELDQAYLEAVRRITDEKLECDFRVQGRFIGAFSPAHHESLVKEYELRSKYIKEEPPEIIPPTERVKMASTLYTGGIWLKNYANVQPARYHFAMRNRAEKMGANIIGFTPVTGIVRNAQHFDVHTARGIIQARDVIIATNGYTGKITPWLAKRLSPINAYMVATEPLPADIAQSILAPRGTYTDTRANPNNIQLSPDGKRLLLGGRTARVHHSLAEVAQHLHRDISAHFPQLESVKISHAWTGRCAATRDFFPHMGVHDGMHYALGYCFAGITVGPYLGGKVAKRILGSAEPKTIFETFRFPKAPWITRQPWAISMYMAWQVGKDRH